MSKKSFSTLNGKVNLKGDVLRYLGLKVVLLFLD